MVKRDAVFSLGAWKGYKYNIKGVSFLSKELHKRLRGWAPRRSLTVYNSVECPSFQPHPALVALRGSQGLNSGLREIENGGAGTRVWNGYALYHSSPQNIHFGLREVNETCQTALLNFPAVRCLRSLRCSLRSRRLEVVGERENGRARGRHARGRCKSVRSRFPDEMTIWTRWELEELGLATVKRATTTCKLFSNIVAKWSEFKRCCVFYYSRFKPVLQ